MERPQNCCKSPFKSDSVTTTGGERTFRKLLTGRNVRSDEKGSLVIKKEREG